MKSNTTLFKNWCAQNQTSLMRYFDATLFDRRTLTFHPKKAKDLFHVRAAGALTAALDLWASQIINDSFVEKEQNTKNYVLVNKNQFQRFWQDLSKPENFCSNIADIEALGESLQVGHVMEISEFSELIIDESIRYGVHKLISHGNKKNYNFVLVPTREAAQEIIKNNISKLRSLN